MNDFIENLWSQFAMETQEHIEEIELHLVEAEQNGASPELVASLFRAFHTLKGLATVMDMNSFARLAHRAEDILVVIRDGEFPFNSDVVSLLLAALDEMKIQRLSAVTSHTNVDANAQLLEHLSETLTSMEYTAVPREMPVAAKTHPDAPLQSDPEMLTYFVELAREKIAVISRLLDPLCTLSERADLLKSPEYVALAAEEIEQLSYAAKTMDFLNLAGILAHLHDALSLESPFSGDQHKAITESLWELHDQIRFIEHSSGNPDAGANSLHTILTDVMHVNIQRLFTRVLDHLDTLQFGSRDGDDLLIAQALQADLSGLNSHLAFFMYNPACNIILMLEDVFSRAARGELHLFSEILEMTREEVTHVMEHYRTCSDGGSCVRDDAEIARNLQRIHDYIWAYESGCGVVNPIETFRQFMGELNIEPELLKILSPENVRDLMQALEKGEQIYEVTAHLESNEEMTARFLAWIETGKSRIITNRSLFIDDMSWYQMLMVSPLSRSDIGQSLTTIDPGGTYLSLKPWSGGIPEREKLLKAIEEAPERQQRLIEPAAAPSNVLRVQGEALDGFMNLIGEMVLARSRMSHIIHHERLSRQIASLKQLRSGNNHDTDELLELLIEHRGDLVEADQLLNDSLRRLQASAVGLRVVPVEMVFKRLPRVVRDLSQSQGKRVRLEMSGQEVKIDKAMVEVLTDPLLHMIRNSIDHGVEMPEERTLAGKSKEAVIRVSATQRGSVIIIEISDDGSGIDADKVLEKALERGLVQREAAASLAREAILRFIFEPGFSTAAVVTETSGRGVGMDVVMTNVMRLGGSIAINSTAGRGSTFTLEMPLSAAIQEVLMVEAAGTVLALPGRYVAEVVEIAADDLQSVRGEQAILLRGAFLPLHRLSALLGYPLAAPERSDGIAVVLTNGKQTIGLAVDKVLRRQELFIKDIQESVASIPGVGGASVLGNGRVVLILDGEDLLRIAKSGVRGV